MANKVKKANRETVRKAIVARREARKQEKAANYAKMRECAKSPAKFAKALDELVAKTARQAYSMDALRENLGLVKFAKEVPAKVRIAAAKNYGKKFVRIAEEQPDILADALQQAYKGLDEQAAAMEIAAEALGIDLGASPAEKAFTDEGKHELELGEDKGEEKATEEGPDFGAEEETEAEEGADKFVSDSEAEAEPLPEEDKEASGSDAFSTDRDEGGSPKAPQKTQSPQAQGEAAKQSAAQGAGKFVKEIPQAQGKTAVTEAKHCPECKYPGRTVEPETGKCRHCKKKVMEPFDKKAAMGKKDFIALADAIKNMSVGPDEKRNIAEGLCETFRASNPRFMKDRFMDYVMGLGGSSGGKVKPQGTPRPRKGVIDPYASAGGHPLE
jgi:hypothetical protein